MAAATIKQAIDLITFDMLNNLDEGETLEVCEGWAIYFYSEGDSLVLVDTSVDWIERLAIQLDFETKEIYYTHL